MNSASVRGILEPEDFLTQDYPSQPNSSNRLLENRLLRDIPYPHLPFCCSCSRDWADGVQSMLETRQAKSTLGLEILLWLFHCITPLFPY